MEGCSAPLVVKFADTQKDKEMKKLQHLQQSVWGSMTQPGAATGPGTISPPSSLLGSCASLTLPLTQTAATMSTPMSLSNPSTQQQHSPFLATSADAMQFLHPMQGIPTLLSDMSMSMQNIFSAINANASLNGSPSSPNPLNSAHGGGGKCLEISRV